MERLSGTTLEQALAPRMPLDRALPILLQLARAMVAAHAAGVVHCDIKPRNIILIHLSGRDDQVKLCDFGLSRLSDGRDRITATGEVLGTPATRKRGLVVALLLTAVLAIVVVLVLAVFAVVARDQSPDPPTSGEPSVGSSTQVMPSVGSGSGSNVPDPTQATSRPPVVTPPPAHDDEIQPESAPGSGSNDSTPSPIDDRAGVGSKRFEPNSPRQGTSWIAWRGRRWWR